MLNNRDPVNIAVILFLWLRWVLIHLVENQPPHPSVYLFYFYLSLAASGLHCCARAFSSCGERGLLLVVVHGLLIAVASLVAENGL